MTLISVLLGALTLGNRREMPSNLSFRLWCNGTEKCFNSHQWVHLTTTSGHPSPGVEEEVHAASPWQGSDTRWSALALLAGPGGSLCWVPRLWQRSSS